MKNKVITMFKIYFLLFLYLVLTASLYIIYLNKNFGINIYIEYFIMVFFFFMLGFVYSNHIHKKGLLVGLLISIFHIIIFNIIFLLTGININTSILKIIINILFGTLGGILGLRFKKFI